MMAAILESIVTVTYNAVTFNDKFYLNPGVTWSVLHKEKPGEVKPLPGYLIYLLPFTLLILVSRFLFERYIALPLGRYLKVSEKLPTPPEPNAILEKAFKSNPKPNDRLIAGLCKTIDRPARFVERWFRRKRALAIPTKMTKFQEGSWRFLAMLSLFTIGFFVVPNKAFWANTRLCWLNYENLTVPPDLFWYYMIELSFYLSLTISQFMDIKRKDFWQMFIHHIVTILLISLSYAVNYVAVGAMIMFVHDMADPWLELAKVIGYTRQPGEGRSKRQTFGEGIFISFMLIFFYTRLYLYPAHCIHSTLLEMIEILGPEPWPMWVGFNILLSTLYVLHWFWSFQIVRVVKDSILAGKVRGDVRSADEDSGNEDTRNGNGHVPSGRGNRSSGGVAGTTNGDSIHGSMVTQR